MNPCFVRREDLSEARKSEMIALLRSQFDGVTESGFAADLAGKDWALLLLGDDDRITGFTTLSYYRSHHDGHPIRVAYSGDTVIDPANWSAGSVAAAWFRVVSELRSKHPDEPLYWLLISSGYRTYRYLPVLAKRFYPCHEWPTPRNVQALMDHLASERFGSSYDASSGIVRLDDPQRLRTGIASMPGQRLADPHLSFFCERNPGHAEGDELVCCTRFDTENMTLAGLRMLRRFEGQPLLISE
jgi:hypothetical protein